MKLDELRRSYTFSSTLLFLLASLSGWSVFNLQVVSIIRLLEGAGIELLPFLMLGQALFSWALIRFWGHSAQGSPQKFFVTALAAGALVVFAAHQPTLETLAHGAKQGWCFYGALFILGQLLVSALRMALHLTFARRVSILSNPQISTQLAIAEQAGFMTGVLGVYFSSAFMGLGSYLTALLPFVAGLVVLAVLGGERRPPRSPAEPAQSAEKKKILADAALSGRRSAPFLTWLLALFSIVASLKSIQWFGMAYGLSEASRQGLHLLSLFSKQSFIQAALTLAILTASLKFSSRIPTWGIGFKILLVAQGLMGAAMAILPTPYVFMGAEIVRKVLENGFLSRSLQLLTSTLPEEQRFESRHLMERWSTTSGIAVAGVLSLLTIHGFMPMSLLWVSMIAMAVGGLVLRRRLFDTLCDFHVARLKQSNLGGVLQACSVLANPDCRHHHAALTSLLERNPRPVMRKGILRALGRMLHPPVVPAILPQVNSDREDIQLVAVRAVNVYKGHEIDFVLLKTLRDMVRSQVPMRLSVVRCITERLGRLVVPYLVEVLETQPDERVSANAVEILGEVAQSEKDEALRSYLAKFLGSEYPRRVRANAVVALYRHRVHGGRALEAFDRLLTSEDAKELDASSYIAGVLRLRGHESFIWERSESLRHANITLLIALLRLQNPKAPKLLARWISGENEDKSRESLVRLSTLDPRVRARVFYEIIETYSEALNVVFSRMRRSQRDFEADRELIRDEVLRLGLTLEEEDPVPSLKEAA